MGIAASIDGVAPARQQALASNVCPNAMYPRRRLRMGVGTIRTGNEEAGEAFRPLCVRQCRVVKPRGTGHASQSIRMAHANLLDPGRNYF
ncbi:hypothetical protein AA102526_0899 [Asaia lannensis NBRC 102526]|nr:hypothetical protein AA102526_0899 [Asaia lannensis NBRC 102526]